MLATAKKAKRILFIARDWNLDGAEKQLMYLVTGINRSLYIPIVLLDRPGALNAQLRAANIETYFLKLHSWRSFPEGMLRYLDALRATLLAWKLQIDLVHTSDFWKTPYTLYIGRMLRIPTIVHVRGPLSLRDVAKHKLSRASGIIAIAQRYCDDLAAAGIPEDRIALIDDAVALDQFQPAPAGENASNPFRRSYNVGSRLAVGLVGRIDRFKRIVEFLELIAAIEPAVRDKALYFIIGQPCDSNRRAPNDYMQVIQNNLERLGLKQSVVFTGRINDMAAALAGLDILVTLSGGSVMFEAMACGKPVLSIRTDDRHSVHTRHNHTAWCVTTDHAVPAANGLVELIENPHLRQRLGTAARDWVQQHLSTATLVDRTQAFYDRLLGGVTPADSTWSSHHRISSLPVPADLMSSPETASEIDSATEQKVS
jgi:glycosyltransferase involved in cell wall biosynthesis